MSEDSPFRNIYTDFKVGDVVTKTFLGRVRMRSRLRFFVFLGLLALAGLGGLLYVADKEATAAIEELQSTQEMANLVAVIEAGALKIFSNEQDFLRHRDIRYAENYDKRIGPMVAALESLHKLSVARNLKKDVSTLNDGVTQHAQQFGKVVEMQKILGFDDGVGLARLLRVSADALDAKITDLKNTALANRIDSIRQYERNLRTAANSEDLEKIEKNLSILGNNLRDFGLAAADRSALGELIESYGADATQYGRVGLILTREVSRLGEINKYMAPSLDSIAALARRQVAQAQQNMAQARERLRLMIAGGSGGIVLLLALFGYILMRSVTVPASALAETANRLAHGDRSVPIPALGNTDAAGEIANALAFFRENMVEADRLRHELEERVTAKSDLAADVEAEAQVELVRPEPDAEDEIEQPEEFVPEESAADRPPEDETAEVDGEIEDSISAISRRVTRTSETASNAAFDAERTDAMISGLIEAQEKIDEVESLVSSIADQTGFLAVESTLRSSRDEDKNVHVLPSSKRGDEKGKAKTKGQPVSSEERIGTIQAMAQRAQELLHEIGGTIDDVRVVANDFAQATSSQALEAATELLHQSEHLRGMLDELLGKIRTGGSRDAGEN